MKLENIHFIDLLPAFMRDDLAVQGLAKSVDELIQTMAGYGKKLSIWTDIDGLEEADLDEIAYEENLVWYEQNAPIETKRDLIRNFSEIKSQLGTCWAVEQVISAYFGSGYVEEWFEYGGDPGYFRVISSNPRITNEDVDKFLRILKKVKRASAHLDGILIGLTGKAYLNIGSGVQVIDRIEATTVFDEKIEGFEGQINFGSGTHVIDRIEAVTNMKTEV